jgi:hypothetical protein
VNDVVLRPRKLAPNKFVVDVVDDFTGDVLERTDLHMSIESAMHDAWSRTFDAFDVRCVLDLEEVP